jgi:hypothetical protein
VPFARSAAFSGPAFAGGHVTPDGGALQSVYINITDNKTLPACNAVAVRDAMPVPPDHD